MAEKPRTQVQPASLSPDYFIDLTTESPPLSQTSETRKRNINSSTSWSSGSVRDGGRTTTNAGGFEIIKFSGRLQPMGKRPRIEKVGQVQAIINLDETAPEATDVVVPHINDSMNNSPVVLSCPICFEDLSSSRKPTSTRCGHLFCAECIERSIKTSKKCPKCQVTITQKSCRRLFF